ncbi:MAG: hypothetical protein U0236_03400 [Nitrospira sp.]
MLAGSVLMWLLEGSVQAAGDPYAMGYDVIGQAERVLQQAAANSPQWQIKQDSIQRDIYHITFLLEQAWRAAEKVNEAAMKDSAHQALSLLQRAVARGHFDPDKVEPIFILIRQLLPDVSV